MATVTVHVTQIETSAGPISKRFRAYVLGDHVILKQWGYVGRTPSFVRIECEPALTVQTAEGMIATRLDGGNGYGNRREATAEVDNVIGAAELCAIFDALLEHPSACRPNAGVIPDGLDRFNVETQAAHGVSHALTCNVCDGVIQTWAQSVVPLAELFRASDAHVCPAA